MNEIKLVVDPDPLEEDEQALRSGIIAFNIGCIKEKASRFSVFAKDKNEKVIGGAALWAHSDAVYIDILWLEEEYRNKGLGSQLMDLIVAETRKKKLYKIFVDTYDFQSLDFYKKQGFLIIATVPQYLLGYDRHYLRKDL